jgi:hypothetical protein
MRGRGRTRGRGRACALKPLRARPGGPPQSSPASSLSFVPEQTVQAAFVPAVLRLWVVELVFEIWGRGLLGGLQPEVACWRGWWRGPASLGTHPPACCLRRPSPVGAVAHAGLQGCRAGGGMVRAAAGWADARRRSRPSFSLRERPRDRTLRPPSSPLQALTWHPVPLQYLALPQTVTSNVTAAWLPDAS